MPQRKYAKKQIKYVRKPRGTRQATTTTRRKPMRMARQMSSIPFPKVKNCTLVYKHPSTTINSGVISGTILQRFKLNSIFDFDYDGNLGNKQPLYYDQLFGPDGPYRYYKVNAWKTTINIINLSSNALNVYYDQGSIGSIAEADTPAEAQNRPGVQYRLLTGAANARPIANFKSFKKTKSFAPRGVSSGLEYGASYNTDPANTIYGTILVGNLSPVDLASFSVAIQVVHTFYTSCYLQDSTLST